MILPSLYFHHHFSNGLVVRLKFERAEHCVPRVISSEKHFQTPEIEQEYKDWCASIVSALIDENVLTEGEQRFIALWIKTGYRSEPMRSGLLGFTHEEWQQKIEDARQESINNCQPQVDDLLAAGWTPIEQGENWQWAWRRPSRRKGKPGRKYLSTNQAWNAMQREQQKANDNKA